jgi:hypothetical protein
MLSPARLSPSTGLPWARPENNIAALSALFGDGRPRFRMSSFDSILITTTRVDAPFDRAELGGELVIVRVDVDLAVLKDLSQVPEGLGSSIDEPLFVALAPLPRCTE